MALDPVWSKYITNVS